MNATKTIKFGYTTRPTYSDFSEVYAETTLVFDNSSREAFAADYNRQVNALLETPVYNLEITL